MKNQRHNFGSQGNQHLHTPHRFNSVLKQNSRASFANVFSYLHPWICPHQETELFSKRQNHWETNWVPADPINSNEWNDVRSTGEEYLTPGFSLNPGHTAPPNGENKGTLYCTEGSGKQTFTWGWSKTARDVRRPNCAINDTLMACEGAQRLSNSWVPLQTNRGRYKLMHFYTLCIYDIQCTYTSNRYSINTYCYIKQDLLTLRGQNNLCWTNKSQKQTI